MPTNSLSVTVFGGTGFLGRRIVRRFAGAGHRVRSASRHPQKTEQIAGSVEQIRADVQDLPSIREAVAGTDVVVNAVSLYVESGGATFHSIHVAGAGHIAEEARRAGVTALVHISGIGSDRNSRNDYIRARGQGEDAVRRAFPEAAVVRPSVMFASGDAFLTRLADMVRLAPVLPLFGSGDTRLQPVHAEDVASAVVCAATRSDLHGEVHPAAGPAIYTYRQLLELIARETGSRTLLMPFPFALWQLTAAVAERLPGAPVSRSQVALMESDNTADSSPIFEICGIDRRTVEATLKEIAASRR